ncbi:MAG: aminotransferase class I/II-fold pyridoxal phosphate-dependent enzyme [Planctomycetales bacterium]|nr:aminotransferase class I/II-fold pyridoxal phosphate-dependent enzyme [Planctomycetales bacterium]NIM08489.1 aminotransferase class I/II-fold pyridoxal phosphate-dependent enzyme [Planctomycetales bacterium]NIN07966.1 aminotransferase class I/II-fold pyridoxal phosphate-dependent enzyme [Planctomycetales bacterium]NIN77095.1 aminotransferase class I/II-fold pyridoxal phosphate-dependent enzyme [Planctomycetales bacterium]NIO34275.1 aminotransferase class I/II-fold pyridoxal phosphate-depende
MDNAYSGSFFYPKTLVHLLRHRAEHQAAHRAFTYLLDGEIDEQHWTYAELDVRARELAAWLQSAGLAGQRALMLYPPGMDFVVAFFGCLYAGVTAVPINPPRRNQKLARIEAIVDDADARVALTTNATLETLGTLIGASDRLKKLTWQATDLPQAFHGDQWQMPEVTPQTLAFLQYTSGSTGTPKGVMLTHDNLMHNSVLICHAFEHTRSSTGVFWLPSYHDMGLIGGILQPLYVGRPNVLMSPMAFLQKPFRWLKAITNYRGTTSGGPNFAYDLCVDKITPAQLEELDLSSWMVAFSGAEPVRAETLNRFCEKFGPRGFRREAFYPCYGLAEGTLIVSGGFVPQLPVVRAFDAAGLEQGQVIQVQPSTQAVELVGCGQTMPDQQVVIADPEQLTTAAANRVGEIWVKGPSIAAGYLARHAESQQTFQAYLADTGEGPFLRTGDLGFQIDGELFVAGRIKDLIIIHGKNYYPQDIEQTVSHCHPRLVADAGAAFTIEEDGKQRLVIVQEVDRQPDRKDGEIIQAIRAAIADQYQLAVDSVMLIRLRSIPKTSSGKIQRFACRQMYDQGSLKMVAQWQVGQPLDAPEAISAADRATTQPDTARYEKGPGAGEDARPANKVPSTPAADNQNPLDQFSGSVEQIVQQVVRHVGGDRVTELNLDTNIVHLGLDSIERMEIIATLEEVYDGRFPESVLTEIETCRQVIEAVRKYLGETPRQRTRQVTSNIPAAHYQFDQIEEYRNLKDLEKFLTSTGLPNPYFAVHEGLTADTTTIDQTKLINFSSYNYLGMSGEPVVREAAKAAIDRFGTSTSASRLVSGEKVVHRDLEQTISDFLGTDAALAFVSGHSTNVTTIGHLFGPGDLVLHDALAHNSIVQGCLLSGARRRPFPHNDYQALDRLLADIRGDYRRVLIAIEGVYSMDGDYCDLPAFVEVKRRHKCFLLIDEAHSVGTMGLHGRGMGEYWQVSPTDVDFWMGTLSKAFGSTGGYIAGSSAVIEYLKYTAPAFVFSGGIGPGNSAAAMAAIQLLEEDPQRVATLQERSALFLQLARQHGLNTGTAEGTPIVPVILGNSMHSLELSHRLRGRGINVQPILYPAVEETASRLRFFVTAKHSEDQIRLAVTATAEELALIDPAYGTAPPESTKVKVG